MHEILCIHCHGSIPSTNLSTAFHDACFSTLAGRGLLFGSRYELCDVVVSVWMIANSVCEAAWVGAWECDGINRVLLLRFAAGDVFVFPDGVACAPRSARAFAAGETGINVDHGTSRQVLRFFQEQQESGVGIGVFGSTISSSLLAFVPPGDDAQCLEFAMRDQTEYPESGRRSTLRRPALRLAAELMRFAPECWCPAPSSQSKQS